MTHDPMCPVKDKPCHGLDNGDCPDEYGHFPSCPQAYCCCSLIRAVEQRERERAAEVIYTIYKGAFPITDYEVGYCAGARASRDAVAAARGGDA